MRRISIGIAVIAMTFLVFEVSHAFQWKEEKSTHFFLYYVGDDKQFAKDVLHRAEKDYVRIARYLGYSRLSNFWTWDKRVKIYIYPSKEEYLKTTSMPEWSAGMADYRKKKIASYVRSEDFLDAILPHVMAHLMLRDFVGFPAKGGSASGRGGEIPMWLDEGVAQWAEIKRRASLKALMKEAAAEDVLIPLEDIMKIDVKSIIDFDLRIFHSPSGSSEKPIVLFFKGEDLVKQYYLQAFSIVAFLIETYGTDKFAVFCREIRKGKTEEEALKSTYTSIIDNMSDLEKGWIEYLKKPD